MNDEIELVELIMIVDWIASFKRNYQIESHIRILVKKKSN